MSRTVGSSARTKLWLVDSSLTLLCLHANISTQDASMLMLAHSGGDMLIVVGGGGNNANSNIRNVTC